MARIRTLQLKDVRCFEGAQSARLGRRITLLVGENSAGKSTFMGCYRVFSELANFNETAKKNRFDEKPFELGGFEQIARAGKSEFSLSGTFEDHPYSSASFAFDSDGILPVNRELQLGMAQPTAQVRIVRTIQPDDFGVSLRFGGPGFECYFRPMEITYPSAVIWLSNYIRYGHLPFAGDLDAFRNQTKERGTEREEQFVRFINFLRRDFRIPESDAFVASALDPVLPERARSYIAPPEHLSPEHSTSVFDFLQDMGVRFQLWTRIILQRARDDATRTEILVDTPNGQYNMIDVGYGVHSLVYLLAAIHQQPPEAVNLLQQPEVHIHPQSQAELAQWMAESGRNFMIETHSDHLVDRFRICVMKGILAPEDLSIVYVQPEQGESRSQIYSIAVDEQGNLEGAPPEFRSFFLSESRSLLGFE